MLCRKWKFSSCYHPFHPPNQDHIIPDFSVDAPEQFNDGTPNAGAEPVEDQVLRRQGRHRGGDPGAVQAGGLPPAAGHGSHVHPAGAADWSDWRGAGAIGGDGERALRLSLPRGRDNAVHAGGGGAVGAGAGPGAESFEPSSEGAE